MYNASRCSPAFCAAAILAFSTLLSQGWAAPLPRPDPDASSDAREAMDDALFATSNPVTPAPLANLFATAPNLEAQTPPQFRATALLPPGWSSNAKKSSQGDSASEQWRPVGNLSWAAPLGALPLRATVTGFAQTDRFFQASNADIDKTGGSARLQIVDPGDDQAVSPYLAVAPRWDFDPTFARQTSARQDFNVGVNKRLNFDANFDRVAAGASTSSATVWSLGLTVFLQRRLREPQASSDAVFVIPSASYASGRTWNASLGVEFLRRWHDPAGNGSSTVQEVEPIATLEYIVPAEALGGEGNAALLGHPAFDLQGSHLKVWSSRVGGDHEQWQAVAALKLGWKF